MWNELRLAGPQSCTCMKVPCPINSGWANDNAGLIGQFLIILTLDGPMMTPRQYVSDMSFSSSNPQLTEPSPPPFCPFSSSSRSRKFRGTTTVVEKKKKTKLIKTQLASHMHGVSHLGCKPVTVASAAAGVDEASWYCWVAEHQKIHFGLLTF